MTKIIKDEANNRIVMDINRSQSSAYSPDPTKRFAYLQYIENNFLNPALAIGHPLKILVLGAGGFTIGVDDEINHYTYIDIDASLKETSEKYLLPKPMGENKEFIAMSARAFLTRDTQRYDLIIIDAYTSIRSIPMEAVTREFLMACREHLAKDGVIISNVISAPDFSNAFTRRYHNSFRNVFPYFTVQPVHPLDNPWSNENPMQDNMLYIYFERSGEADPTIYTDDRNTYSLDR